MKEPKPVVTSHLEEGHPSRGLVPELPLHVHLLGAGGAGLSGAARLLALRGHVVTGYDREPSPFSASLCEMGVPLALGPSAREHLPASAQAVVRSAAVPDGDPQLVAARERGLVELKYAELLGRVTPAGRSLAVAGTHGKTSTSWMLFQALDGITRAFPEVPAPGALVGGLCMERAVNSIPGAPGGWFAAEACEYDRSFLNLEPAGALVTNVEADHLDCYGTFEAVEEAFARFIDRVHPDGLLVLGPDVPARVEAASAADVWRVGRELQVDLCSESRGYFEFRLRGPGWATPPTTLAVPGAINVGNAALALGLAVGVVVRVMRLPADQVAEAAAAGLARFRGVTRRFEHWGHDLGVDVVHDYAHHPTEVSVTLEAARRVFPGAPLHVLFQPHQYSRTARFMAEFVEALRVAERVVVADVYGARQHIDSKGAGADELVRRLQLAGVEAVLGGSPAESCAVLTEGMPFEAAALILGAGDIDCIKDDLLHRLALRSAVAR